MTANATMDQDKIEKVLGAEIQHGKINDRIYLMTVSNSKIRELARYINKLAEENNYSKIFAKIPEWAWSYFEKYDYEIEGKIPKFYNGQVKCLFVSKFLTEARQKTKNKEEILKIIEDSKAKSRQKKTEKTDTKVPEKLEFFTAEESDAEALADIYGKVFDSYPFPIHDPDFIRQSMKSNTVYFCCKDKNKIVAASSAETDPRCSYAEMTDFATLPKYRKKGIASCLLKEMEKKMGEMEIKTVYTIARAISPGMNFTFGNSGYTYSGTLVNNTQISGQLESMNIWYKAVKLKSKETPEYLRPPRKSIHI